MQRILLVALVVFCGMAAPVAAQDEQAVGQNANVAAQGQGDANQVTMTPEIWQYLQQMQQYETARQKVWRRAEFQAAQRRMRIASREWYGVSLSRPMASPVPHTGVYSGFWAGTYQEPALWMGHHYYPNYAADGYGIR